ncbi:MAG TPA: GntR family transcriptional regulator [Thermodesulfobacteriota bacterium]|nr:GntR family transcriptional regulator [Thermodesulfobacteriota bacterium]
MIKLPLRRTSQKNSIPVREMAYEFLKSSVLSGHLNPGERLTEEYLAKKLGVSRTPVREALHKLESEGLIKPLETRGFIVSRDSKDEVEELFELRAILEGHALRIICERISEEDLKQLGRLIAGAEDALRRKRMEDVFKWNTKFHDTLHGIVVDKKRLHRLLVNIRKYVLRYRRDTLRYPDGGERAVDGHRKILLALRLKDPDLCERMMREHIQEAKVDAEQFLFEKTEESMGDKI